MWDEEYLFNNHVSVGNQADLSLFFKIVFRLSNCKAACPNCIFNFLIKKLE